MSSQIIVRPGGRQVIFEVMAHSAARVYEMQNVTFPDYYEHDGAKECVLIHRVQFETDQAAVATMGAAATLDAVRVGWRSGLWTPTDCSYKFLQKLMYMKRGATSGAFPVGGLRAEIVHEDPIACNINGMTTVIHMISSGATTFDASGYTRVYVEYSWGKMGQSEILAISRWEAFGN